MHSYSHKVSHRNSMAELTALEPILETKEETMRSLMVSPEKADNPLAELREMLISKPDADAKPVALWSKMKPLTPDVL